MLHGRTSLKLDYCYSEGRGFGDDPLPGWFGPPPGITTTLTHTRPHLGSSFGRLIVAAADRRSCLKSIHPAKRAHAPSQSHMAEAWPSSAKCTHSSKLAPCMIGNTCCWYELNKSCSDSARTGRAYRTSDWYLRSAGLIFPHQSLCASYTRTKAMTVEQSSVI